MAVTIVQNPQQFSQSGQPLIFTFSSNQTGQANFSYVVEVYVASNLVYTAKVLPITGIYSFFDASEVAERYLKLPSLSTNTYTSEANNLRIYLTVRENYGTPPTNQASANTDFINVYKAKSKYTFISSQYIIGNNTKFLTNFESKKLYNFGSQRLFNIAFDDIPPAYYDFRDSTGTQIKLETESTSVGNILNIYFTYSNVQTVFGAGTFTDVAYFDYYLDRLSDGSELTEKYRIFIDHSDCSTFQNEITFLNFLGGLDVYHFTRMKRYTKTSKPNQFKTNEGVLNSNGTFTTLGTSGQFNYQITQDETMTLQTGWISESDYNILNEQLLTSPFVLLNGKRVAITEATAEEKYRKFDTLFNFTITIKQKSFTSTVV